MSATLAPVDPFTALAAELSRWPTLTRRLLDTHPAQTRDGLCPACSTPGGRLLVPTPCGPRNLAVMAARLAGGDA